jgi:hypothetical protein
MKFTSIESELFTDLVLLADHVICRRGCWVNSVPLRGMTKVNQYSSSSGYILMVCLD